MRRRILEWTRWAALAAVLVAGGARAHQITGTDIALVAVLSVDYDAITGAYELQYGEISAFDVRQIMDADGDKLITETERQAYLDRVATELGQRLVLELDGEPLSLTVGESEMLPGQPTVTPGQMTVRFMLSAGPVDFTQPHRLSYRDLSEHPRLIHSDVSIEGLALVDVDPAGLSPRQGALKEVYFQAYERGVEAEAVLIPSAAAWGGMGRSARAAQDAPATGLQSQTGRLQDMLKQDELSTKVVVVALVLALFLGAAHALEPGHGKTLVSAYLIGSRGTVANALFLGLVVTLTHTLSVIVLGIVTLFASQYVLPEQIFPWLGAGSGLLIIGLGAWLFTRTVRGGAGHFHFGGGDHHHGPGGHDHGGEGHGHEAEHSHDHGEHDHAHEHGHEHGDAHSHDHAEVAREPGHTHEHPHDHDHDHDHDHGHDADDSHDHGDGHEHSHGADHDHDHPHPHGESEGAGEEGEPQGKVSMLTMLTLGITGGIIPCPGALVILLLAVGLHRIGLGLTLIVSFSFGLAAVLIIIGVLMVKARPLMERFTGDGKWIQRLPIVSSLVIMCVGFAMAVRALMEAGIVIINL